MIPNNAVLIAPYKGIAEQNTQECLTNVTNMRGVLLNRCLSAIIASDDPIAYTFDLCVKNVGG